MTHGNSTYETSRHRRAQLSRHAEKRAQQRCISKLSLPLVLAYGKREYDGHGGIRYLMTTEAVANLRRAVGHTRQVEELEGVYAVVSANSDTVITIGHRVS